MCSLFGWLDYQGIIPDKMKKKLTQALANAAEERGTDAAGISYIKDGKVAIFKRPKPAHKIHFNAPEGTMVIMGHTRMTTQGDEKHNYNNHPFSGNAGGVNFAFAHNGVLYNDTTLRKEKHLPATQIETDSYVAVQLIEQADKLDFESMKYMAETVSGSFCFTTLDENGKLYIVKWSNPMCLLHFEDLGLYVYASTQSIVNKALKKVGLNKFRNTELKMTDGDILSIDSSGNIERAEFEPAPDTRYNRYNFGGWYDGWFDASDDDGYTIHEQMLFDICNCYGIDNSDVELLLEYGYDCDEIEEMLMDYDLLIETLNELKGCEEYSCYGELIWGGAV